MNHNDRNVSRIIVNELRQLADHREEIARALPDDERRDEEEVAAQLRSIASTYMMVRMHHFTSISDNELPSRGDF
jgi:hypothetical protein